MNPREFVKLLRRHDAGDLEAFSTLCAILSPGLEHALALSGASAPQRKKWQHAILAQLSDRLQRILQRWEKRIDEGGRLYRVEGWFQTFVIRELIRYHEGNDDSEAVATVVAMLLPVVDAELGRWSLPGDRREDFRQDVIESLLEYLPKLRRRLDELTEVDNQVLPTVKAWFGTYLRRRILDRYREQPEMRRTRSGCDRVVEYREPSLALLQEAMDGDDDATITEAIDFQRRMIPIFQAIRDRLPTEERIAVVEHVVHGESQNAVTRRALAKLRHWFRPPQPRKGTGNE